MSDADLDGPEWIDPAAAHHRDLTALTAAVRGELDRAVRRVNATLGMADRPLLQRLTRVTAGNAGFPGATSPGQAPGRGAGLECRPSAASLTCTPFLRQQEADHGPGVPAPTFGHAAESFVIAHAAPGAWSAGTAVKYRQTLAALGGQLDGAGWVTADPTAGWARPKVPVDTTRALTRAQVAATWKLDVPLQDKALWRMLYETAARAEEILGLDVPDLDLPSKRGRVISKGGTTDWVHWQTGTAMLLPRLLAGRREGPVFLTSRKPGHAVASGDLCPVTRRARLSYRRAAESFERATRPLANPGARHEELEEVHGWTLHKLRHSLLTHQFRRRHQHPDAARPVPPRLRPVPRALRPPRTRGRRTPRRRRRPSRPAPATMTGSGQSRYLTVILIVVSRWMVPRALAAAIR